MRNALKSLNQTRYTFDSAVDEKLMCSYVLILSRLKRLNLEEKMDWKFVATYILRDPNCHVAVRNHWSRLLKKARFRFRLRKLMDSWDIYRNAEIQRGGIQIRGDDLSFFDFDVQGELRSVMQLSQNLCGILPEANAVEETSKPTGKNSVSVDLIDMSSWEVFQRDYSVRRNPTKPLEHVISHISTSIQRMEAKLSETLTCRINQSSDIDEEDPVRAALEQAIKMAALTPDAMYNAAAMADLLKTFGINEGTSTVRRLQKAGVLIAKESTMQRFQYDMSKKVKDTFAVHSNDNLILTARNAYNLWRNAQSSSSSTTRFPRLNEDEVATFAIGMVATGRWTMDVEMGDMSDPKWKSGKLNDLTGLPFEVVFHHVPTTIAPNSTVGSVMTTQKKALRAHDLCTDADEEHQLKRFRPNDDADEESRPTLSNKITLIPHSQIRLWRTPTGELVHSIFQWCADALSTLVLRHPFIDRPVLFQKCQPVLSKVDFEEVMAWLHQSEIVRVHVCESEKGKSVYYTIAPDYFCKNRLLANEVVCSK